MSASRKRCCTPCVDNTGCGGSNTLCTGKSFVLPHLDSVSVSGSQSVDDSDDPYFTTHPYEFYSNSGGTIAGNGYGTVAASTLDPIIDASYTVSFAAVDHEAFRSPVMSAGYTGYKLTITVGGVSNTFDATGGTGVTFSSSVNPQTRAKGTWVVGPEVTPPAYPGDYTVTETITAYDFEQNIVDTLVEYEVIQFSVGRAYIPGSNKFSYSVNYTIIRGYTWSMNRLDGWARSNEYVDGVNDHTKVAEQYGGSITTKTRAMYAAGTVFGLSDTIATICDGDGDTFAVEDSDATPGDGLAEIRTAGGGPSSGGFIPTNGGTFPAIPATPQSSNTDAWASGSCPTGNVTMSLDTGTWTEREVGFRDCPRYLNFSGTISDVDGDDDATISGRLVMVGVPECSWYQGAWETNGTSATATLVHPSSGSSSVAVSLRWLGPSLWQLTIGSTGRMTYYVKFAGDCPIGSPTVCQALNPYDITLTGASSASASRDQYIGSGGYDIWYGVGHPVTAGDLGSYDAAPLGYANQFTEHSFTFTETDRETGDPDYFCEGFKAWNTGEESDEFGSDLHWTVENANESGVFVPAVVQTDNSFLVYYATPVADAAWIGIDEHGSYYGGIRRYRTTITVEGTLADDITGNVSSDNQTLAIYINGTLRVTTPTPTGVDSHELKHDFTLDAAWFTTGINTVDFEVNDDVDSEPHANGLLVEWDD